MNCRSCPRMIDARPGRADNLESRLTARALPRSEPGGGSQSALSYSEDFMSREFKGVWIPAVIWLSTGINALEN